MQVADNEGGMAGESSPDSHAGTRLRTARENQGMTLDDVAHALHLDRDVIAALESGDFAVLGAPVFVRGHLRGYARLLGLPEQPFIAAVDAEDPDPEAFRTQSLRRELQPGISMTNMALGLLLLLLVAVAIYLYMNRNQDTVSVVRSEVSIAPQSAELSQRLRAVPAVTVAEAPDAENAASVNGTAGSSKAEPEAQAAVVVTIPVAASGAAAPASEPLQVLPTSVEAGRLTLEMSFNAECWVEIADARRRLLYGLEKPGSVRRFQAEPPLRFFLGNVDAAVIRIANNTYQVPEEQRTGNNTARFVLTQADIAGLGP